MSLPTFPDFHCEVVRDAVIARSDDPGEPDQTLGCTVVGECLIRGRKARAVVGIDRAVELERRNDDALVRLARPGLSEAFRELAESQAS